MIPSGIYGSTSILPEVTYLGSSPNSANGSSYDFGEILVPAGGLLAVIMQGVTSGSAAADSVSVGLLDVTRIERVGGIASPFLIASAPVEAGVYPVTGQFSASMNSACCHFFLLNNLVSSTPVDSFGLGSQGNDVSIILDLSKNGIAIYGAHHNQGGNGFRWDGAEEVADISSGGAQFSAAVYQTSDEVLAYLVGVASPNAPSAATIMGYGGASWA